MDGRVKKYVICGHYGATNLGDEAIGMGLIQAIKSANPDHEVVVMSYDKNRSDVFYALRLGKPLYLIGHSVGPLKSRVGK